MTEITEAEKGRVQPPPPSQADESGLPRGGSWNVPHFIKFGSRLSSFARAYSQRYDEALRYSREDADRMRLDPVIYACLQIRAFTASQLSWSIEPDDPENPDEKAAAEAITKHIKKIPRLVEGFRWLLYDGIFCGRSALDVRYGWTGKGYWAPNAFQPVLGDKLGFKWNQQVGIAVQAGAMPGDKTTTTDLYPIYWLNSEERECLVVHRQFAEDADYYRYIGAGGVHGRGLRHHLYWLWKLKQEIWSMSLDYLQWYARGLMIYYFAAGNQTHQDAVKDWIEKQDGNSAMMFPVMLDKDGKPYFEKPVERFDVGTASPQFLQNLIVGYFDDLIKFCILHQTATTSAVSTGIGSSVAQAHETTFDAVVKMDAVCLGETMQADLVLPMYRANHPGIEPGRFKFNIDTPNAQSVIDSAERVVGMGGTVGMEGLLETAGIPLPKKNDTLLGTPQPNQPSAIGAVPDNTPVMGNPTPPVTG